MSDPAFGRLPLDDLSVVDSLGADLRAAQADQGGYRLTEHVAAYYRTARV